MSSLLGGALVLCFASWLTVHLAIAHALLRSPPRWRALVTLLPPLALLAPHWALKQGMFRLATFWVLSAVTYLALLFAARA